MHENFIIQDLFIYPIKSLGGIRLNEAKVEERGFQFDRRWMLVDPQGLFLTQRTHTQMALLQVELGETGLIVFDKSNPQEILQIPYQQISDQEIEVEIWDDKVIGNIVDPSLDTWFSEKLGMPCHLVKMPESTHRKVSPKYAVNDESVSFADGMPYLILGQESLNDLNSRLEKPVPMDRFRPNIVFSGGQSYVEDSWKKIRIGGVKFQVVKPCARCVLTTIDQETGFQGKEPLKTLAGYRTIGNKVFFAQNMVALETGTIKIGDQIIVES
ncbi:MAG: MOSC domain-containing protein [Algoriphagus sp.]|nr:MOSC domain-containing protein [Algoriphagus sp.]